MNLRKTVVIIAYVRIIAFMRQIKGSVFVISELIKRRRKELKMSVDELAKRIGKDRSTVYRYENGDIGNMPMELLAPMVEALELTPQQLFSAIMAKNEWLSNRVKELFDFNVGYEFNEEEEEIFYEVAKYLMNNRNNQENIKSIYVLFKQLNK